MSDQQQNKCEKCGAPVIYVQMDSGHRVPVDKYTIEERIVIRKDGTASRDKCGISHFKTCQRKQRWAIKIKK
tara:strand:+ start:44451 stop:44666 length:216 start_codon:yes stop_codon:yes gene_type:complete